MACGEADKRMGGARIRLFVFGSTETSMISTLRDAVNGWPAAKRINGWEAGALP